MDSLNKYISAYKEQLEKGDIKKAYKALMEYIMNLRIYFKNKYPDYSISGSIYYGHMDMTYFAFTPEDLRDKKLKVAIVFIHETAKFEIWLAGNNKQIQTKYWKLFKESDWNKYNIPPNIKDVDSIVEHTLVENPDFDNLDNLTEQIECGTLRFIEDIQNFLDEKSN